MKGIARSQTKSTSDGSLAVRLFDPHFGQSISTVFIDKNPPRFESSVTPMTQGRVTPHLSPILSRNCNSRRAPLQESLYTASFHRLTLVIGIRPIQFCKGASKDEQQPDTDSIESLVLDFRGRNA